MQAVILAAGRGTRMGDLSRYTPKPMLKLLDKPILEWSLGVLPECIDEVIIITGYLEEQIKEYFGERWSEKKITYVTQTELNGTGGAMHSVHALLSGPALVLNADDLYLPEDLEALTETRNEGGAVLALHTDDAQAYGLLGTNEQQELLSIVERPHGHTEGDVYIGAGLITPRFFEFPLVRITDTEYGLPQTLALVSKEYPVKVLAATAWQPVGKPEDLTLGEAFIKKYYR